MKEVHEMSGDELESELKFYDDRVTDDLVQSKVMMLGYTVEYATNELRAVLYKKRKLLTIFMHIYLRLSGKKFNRLNEI